MWVSTNNPEYDEMNVNMYWENQEAFEVWRESDAFKAAHKRPEPAEGHPQAAENSPMLGSQLVISELASSIAAE